MAICNLLDIRYPVIERGLTHIHEFISGFTKYRIPGIIGSGRESKLVKLQAYLTIQPAGQPVDDVHILFLHYEEFINTILKKIHKAKSFGACNQDRYTPQFKHADTKVLPVITGRESYFQPA